MSRVSSEAESDPRGKAGLMYMLSTTVTVRVFVSLSML